MITLIQSSCLMLALLFTRLLVAQENDLFTELDLKNLQLSANQTKILNMIRAEEATVELKVVRVNLANFTTAQSINLNLFAERSFLAVTSRIDHRSRSQK